MGRFGKRKGKTNNKHNNKQHKKPKKPRKTYSLYGNNKQERPKPQERNEVHIQDKQRETSVQKETSLKYLSSESEEELDDMTQLRSTFVKGNKLLSDSKAIESSDESDGNDGEQDLHSVDMNDAKEENDFPDDLSEENDLDEAGSDVNLSDMDDHIESTKISDSLDPFTKHVSYDLSLSLLSSLQTPPIDVNISNEEWPHMGTMVIQIPKCIEQKQEKQEGTMIEERLFAPGGTIPKRIHASKDNLNSLYIKSQIRNNLAQSNTSLVNKEKSVPLTSLQSELFSVINNYQDLYYPQRTFDSGEELRFVYCLHVVNHILKSRMRIIHHNVRLTKKDDVPEEFRDQGLVRPKVLIVVPFKSAAYKIVLLLINILITENKGNVINKNRFLEDFTGNELILPKKNPKPEDYEVTFAGNSSDDFKIGISVTKKSLKLYTDFYSSDIIIASPLGLRYTIGADGEADRDYDFLASIELLILDQTEIFLMQNWDHVMHIMKHMHLQPKDSHGTDFSRVRTWSLNGWAKYYRQTLIFSSVLLPEINAVFNKYCANFAGKVKVIKKIDYGCIRQVYVQLPHVFQKINANSVEHSIDARFKYFINKIVPQQRDPLMKQTLIYISNYFDYVKVRNYFKKEDINFVQICEYSKMGKIARARDMFFHGDAHFLLYTERHHFFNRIKVKGIRHLVFYQPPNFPNFYYEICNFMQEANMNKKIGSLSNMTVTVLYTKYDVQQLAEIVGMERAGKMIQSEKNVHLLVTDDE